jgi:formylglycine-generating enzyme required for sulfatase activity
LGPELVPIRAGDARWSCIDRSEVTRAQYKKWWEATPWDPFGAIAGCSGEAPTPTAEWNTKAFDNPERPVTFVSWCFAARFCKAAGKRLCGKIGGGAIEAAARNDPAHSEWFASCSSAGTYKYPYGDAFNPSGCNGVGAGNGHSVAVFSLAQCKTPEGVFDLSGNVWEWVDSCEPNGSCLNRGGGFNAADPQSLACAASTVEGVATPKATTAVTIGFRCCAEYVY